MGFMSSVGKSFKNLSGLGGSIGNLGLTTPGMGFGDIKDLLFGKDPSVATGTVGKWNKGQQELFNTLQRYLNKGIAPGAPYEGKLPGTAPIGSLEQMSLAGLEKLFSGDLFKQLSEGPGYGGFEKQTAEGVGPYDQFQELFTSPVLKQLLQGPGPGVLPEAKNAITSMLQIRPEDIDQYYKTTVSDPMMQQFTEEIMPAIKRAGAPRLWGTDYQTQEQYATRDLERGLIQGRGAATSEYLNRALSAAGLAPSISEAESRGIQTQQAGYQTLADILSKGVSDYTSIIGTKSTAEAQRMAAEAQKAGLTPTFISTMMSALSQGAQLGSVPRQIEEAGLTAQYQEWQRQQQEEKTRVNQILAALGLQPMDTYAFAQGAQPGLIQSFVGSEGGSSGIAALLLKLLSSGAAV